MLSRFAVAAFAAAALYCATLPASAEDVGVGPGGVTIGDHDRARDRDDRDHKKIIIKKDNENGTREKTVIKKGHDRDHDD